MTCGTGSDHDEPHVVLARSECNRHSKVIARPDLAGIARKIV